MGIKRAKLNYQPVAKRTSNEIAFVVSKEHLSAVNNSIHNKVKRNHEEIIQSVKNARNYHVGHNGSDKTFSKSLVKAKKRNL